MLAKDLQVQLIRPPVLVRPGSARYGSRGGDNRVFAFATTVRHVVLLLSRCLVLLVAVDGCWVAVPVASPAWRRLAAGRDGRCRDALGTSTPIDDLGFADLVARVVDRREAGGVAHRAVDVGDSPARPADHVVVVVADSGLVTRDGAHRLDAPHQAGSSQCTQHVIDGLVRHLSEIVTYD